MSSHQSVNLLVIRQALAKKKKKNGRRVSSCFLKDDTKGRHITQVLQPK